MTENLAHPQTDKNFLGEKVTETELKEAAVAPRVTPEDIREEIQYVAFSSAYDLLFNAAHSLQDGEGNTIPGGISSLGLAEQLNSFTICVIVLKSGFTVTGQSAPVDPKNFSKEIGERLAYQDAFNKLWAPFGFALKQHFHYQSQTEAE